MKINDATLVKAFAVFGLSNLEKTEPEGFLSAVKHVRGEMYTSEGVDMTQLGNIVEVLRLEIKELQELIKAYDKEVKNKKG